MHRLARVSKTFLVAMLLVGALAFALPAGTQSVAATDLFNKVCEGAGSASAGCPSGSENNISGANGVLLKATGLIAIIGAIAAVIVIMIGGFLLVTAGGDSARISSGKKTITYALVGLVVMALARLIITFVVNRF